MLCISDDIGCATAGLHWALLPRQHHKLASPSADHHYQEASRHRLAGVPALSQSLI